MRYALVLLFVATTALGQVQEKITVNVVEVPVTVVGKDGEPVRGLTAANFQVLDDGKRRDVSGFEAIDFATQKNLTAISQLPPAARRNFVILFDLSYSSPASVTRARKAASEFITKMAQPTDRLAVATIDVVRGFRLVTGFTTDRVLLAQAIQSPETFRGFDPLQIAGPAILTRPMAGEPGGMIAPGDVGTAEDSAGDGEAGDGGRAVQAGRKAMKDAANLQQLELARLTERDDQAYQADKVEKQIDLLGGLAHALRSVTGRKFVVFLSDGFDARTVQGSETRGGSEADDLAAAREKGEVWKFDNDKRFGNSTTMAFYQQMSELFKRSDVVLHAIDTKGLRVNVDARTGVTTSNNNDSLFLLANATGGTVFRNTNDIASDFARLVRQEEVVYVLAFSAPSSEPGRFHPLKVKLVNVPGARVQHRAGYYETGAESEAEQNISVAQIIVNDIPRNGLRVTALPVAFRGEGDVAQVPVVVDVAGVDLLAAADDEILLADVFIYAFNAEGRVGGSAVQRMTLDLKKVSEKLRAGGLKYLAMLDLPPGTYAVKTLVRLPEIGRDGFSRTELTVPAASELALTRPIFFDDPARWVLVKGKGEGYPFAAGEETFIPSAGTGASGWPRQFAVFVQNASPDEVSFETSTPATLLSLAPGAGGTAAVFRVDQAPKAADLAVTVTTKKETRKSAVSLQ